MTSRRHFINVSICVALTLSLGASLAGTALTSYAQKPPLALLNVSYDPTRELHNIATSALFSRVVPAIN